MVFANPLPWWALVLIAAAAVLLARHAYRGFTAWPGRRYALSTLRCVTLLLLVVVLMRPVTRSADIDARDTVVPILVDRSRSMALEDSDRGRRIDRARELVAGELLPALTGRFQVEVLSFGETLEAADPAALSASARRSDLAGALGALRERYRGRPIAGVIVLSDGGETSGALEAVVSTGRIPPVHTIGFGSANAGGDREVLSVTAAEAVLDGSRVNVAVSAIAHDAGSAPVELRLLENGRPREVRHVRLPADGGPIREVFQVAPAAGAATVYSVEIPPAPGELVPENNRRSVLVQPPSRPRRVLVVEGAPGFEHSFLQRALTGDRSLEIDSVVRKGENEQGADTYYIQAARSRSGALRSGYPPDAASLFAYDALVFANVGSDQLTTPQLDSTRDFVTRRGGGLLVLGAQSFLNRGLAGTAVEDALPVQLNRRVDSAVPAGATRAANRVSLTNAGAEHPVTQIGATPEESRKRWEGLPALAGAAALGTPRPGASILAMTTAGGAARPLIAVQRYGEGRSMVFAGEASWRWRMMLPSTDRSYETFWRQAVRWLALGATDPVSILPAPAVGAGDEVVIRTAVRDASFYALRDAEVDVRVSGPDGRMETLRGALEEDDGNESSVFAARFIPQQPGLYRVNVSARQGRAEAGSAASSLLVGGADVEMSDPRLNTALLARLASSTGGRAFEAGRLDDLPGLLRAGASASALATRKDLWHNAWSLVLIIGLLAGEWLLRRRWGLR
ncbi:MAG TPA: glutamine amidotransferase [Vicinamibacterales bacterium]|nr:glutamine amidotransferase [Vicinamibacterales bacterium]